VERIAEAVAGRPGAGECGFFFLLLILFLSVFGAFASEEEDEKEKEEDSFSDPVALQKNCHSSAKYGESLPRRVKQGTL
jgi:hypothetical protein